MNGITPFIVLGLTAGSLYALAGVGLVLTYKISGIFNFALGAIATVAAYVFYYLHVQEGVDWPLAAAIAVFGVGVLFGVAFEPLARALSRATLAMQVGATVGIFIFVQGLFVILYGTSTRNYPQFLPARTFEVFGAHVSVTQIIIMGLVLVLTIGLFVFFRWTRLGVAMRGVVDNSDLLDLVGTNPRRVRRVAWMIGCVFATLTGVLLAPSLQLDPTALTFLVIGAIGAASVGGFTNLPLSYGGGLAIGIVGSILTKYITTNSAIFVGIPTSLPFMVLFVVMLVMPRRWRTVSERIAPTRSTWSAPLRVQLASGGALLVLLLFIPQLTGVKVTLWTEALTYVILFMSLGLLVRTSGLVSLCQVTFAAIGAAAFAHLSSADLGWPWVAALIVSGLIAVPIGAFLAIPAIRLGGLYLALATFGFGVLVQYMFYGSFLMFGAGGLPEPMPHVAWVQLDTGRGFYYLVLFITVLCVAAAIMINRSRLGRLLRGMADSPVALATNGTSVNVTRVIVFSISAFMASIAGALYGVTNTFASQDSFQPITSLTLVALIVIAVGDVPWYAVLAAGGFVLIPAYVTASNTMLYLQLVFGVSAVGIALAGTPRLPMRLLTLIDRLGGRRPVTMPAPQQGSLERTTSPVSAGVLKVRDLRVDFGGLRAVDRFSLSAPTGRITGLIGPNGAGKTTTFNAVCGLVRPTEGQILIDGKDVTRTSTAGRARLGIGRTFQQVELFDSLTVGQNVALGREASMAGANPLTQLASGRGDSKVLNRAVEEALALCDLADLTQTTAGSLSTGRRRLVELARCLAGPFRFLLLDEPSSGLDRLETTEFGRILRRVVNERGVGVLLVEHDMALVMEVCEHIYVLDFGIPLFEGSPEEVAHAPAVQAAYLGTYDAIESGAEQGQ